jgi:hypothetical protein
VGRYGFIPSGTLLNRPRATQVFSHEDMLRRYDDYFSRFEPMKAVARHYICERECVTLLWAIDMAREERCRFDDFRDRDLQDGQRCHHRHATPERGRRAVSRRSLAGVREVGARRELFF